MDAYWVEAELILKVDTVKSICVILLYVEGGRLGEVERQQINQSIDIVWSKLCSLVYDKDHEKIFKAA